MLHTSILILFTLPLVAVPLSSFADQSLADLNEKYEPAVVKIEIKEGGVPVSWGSGFFVSKDGKLVTNLHVVKEGLGLGFSLSVITKDKKTLTDVSVIECGDKREIDLCLLKVNFAPKSWFDVRPIKLKKGIDLASIGHPQGYDYSLSQGILSGVHRMGGGGFVDADESPEGKDKAHLAIEMVQTTAAISPGNSGGPIFDRSGALVGVATWIRADQGSENLNFAISANEISKYIQDTSKTGTPFAQFRESFVKKKREAARVFHVKYIVPQSNAFLKGDKPDSRFLHDESIPFNGQNYQFSFFNSMKGCRTSSRANVTMCLGKGFVYTLALRQDPPGSVKSMEGKMAPPRPLPVVAALQKSGKWEKYKDSLTIGELKLLYSNPSPYQCQKVPPSQANALLGDADRCWTKILNEMVPNSVLATTDFQLANGVHISSTMWVDDFALEQLAIDISSIVGGSIRADGKVSSVNARGLGSIGGNLNWDSLPKKIVFNGLPLIQKSNTASAKTMLAEYIPDGESLDAWATLFAIRFTRSEPVDVVQQAKAAQASVAKRKADGDTVANSAALLSSDKKSAVVDFVVSQNDLIERNVQRFFNVSGGFVSFQYATRVYRASSDKNAVQQFFQSIKSDRNQVIDGLMSKSLPFSNSGS
jgi:hypothetical protein